MRRRDQPDVDADARARRPPLRISPVSQEPERASPGRRGRARRPRPGTRCRRPPPRRGPARALGGAGERAALVAEELALEELAGERAAVHGHERAAAARDSAGGARRRRAPCPCRSRRGSAPARRTGRRAGSGRRAPASPRSGRPVPRIPAVAPRPVLPSSRWRRWGLAEQPGCQGPARGRKGPSNLAIRLRSGGGPGMELPGNQPGIRCGSTDTACRHSLGNRRTRRYPPAHSGAQWAPEPRGRRCSSPRPSRPSRGRSAQLSAGNPFLPERLEGRARRPRGGLRHRPGRSGTPRPSPSPPRTSSGSRRARRPSPRRPASASPKAPGHGPRRSGSTRTSSSTRSTSATRAPSSRGSATHPGSERAAAALRAVPTRPRPLPRRPGVREPAPRAAAHVFAGYYQVRRAFHHIHATSSARRGRRGASARPSGSRSSRTTCRRYRRALYAAWATSRRSSPARPAPARSSSPGPSGSRATSRSTEDAGRSPDCRRRVLRR